jgi:O-antigen/teichoic acid export membrane protein
MNELVVKYVGQFSEQGDQPRAAAVFKAAALTEMGASIIAYAVIWVLAPIGAQYFAKDAALATWFAIYGLIVLTNLMAESSTGLLQINDRFRRIAAMNLAQSIVSLVLIVVVFVMKGGLLGILIAYLAGKAVSSLGITISAIAEANRQWGVGWWRTSLWLLRPQARELAMFGVSTNISASLSLVNKDSELLWVSFFRGPLETGWYKLALSLANLVQMPISPLPQTTYPVLSREVARKQWLSVRTVLRQGAILAGSYTVVAVAGLIIIGQPLIRYVYKPEFLPAYPALVILLMGFLVANTFYWNRVALLALGRPNIPTIINVILATLKIIGIFILVPIYGYLASAALLSGSYIIGVTVCVLIIRSILNQKQRDEAV